MESKDQEITSLQRAKAKYARTEKGKECQKKYREKHKERNNELSRQSRERKKLEFEKYKNFYLTYVDIIHNFEKTVNKDFKNEYV